MNTDIRLSTQFLQHPKTVKLKRRLGLEGLFSLLQLWTWVAQNKPSGILSGMDDEDVSIAAGWEGDDEAFCDTLVDLRWLDLDEDGTYRLHNWEARQEYASKSEERVEKAKKAAAARWNKQAASNADKELSCQPDVCGQCDDNANSMLENACSNAQACNEHPQAMPPTQPNLTEVLRTSDQDPPTPPEGEDTAQAPEEPTEEIQEQQPKRKRTDYRRKDFEEWKTEYGAKVDDERLWKVWKKQIRKIPEQPVLMAALARYKQSKRWQDGFAKDPDNYLRGCCWNDEFPPAQPQRASPGPHPQGQYQQPAYGAKKTVDEKVRSTAAGLYRILTRDEPSPGPMDLDNILDAAPINALAQGDTQ